MELAIKNQLEKEPNKWIKKALTTLFIVLIAPGTLLLG